MKKGEKQQYTCWYDDWPHDIQEYAIHSLNIQSCVVLKFIEIFIGLIHNLSSTH